MHFSDNPIPRCQQALTWLAKWKYKETRNLAAKNNIIKLPSKAELLVSAQAIQILKVEYKLKGSDYKKQQ